MEALLFPQKIKTASRTSFALQNQLYQRIEEKVLRDRITRTKDLSYRENNVAVFLAQGFIINEIADVLSISPETVETHRKNIYSKLGIHRQVELVCWFVNQFFKGNIKN